SPATESDAHETHADCCRFHSRPRHAASCRGGRRSEHGSDFVLDGAAANGTARIAAARRAVSGLCRRTGAVLVAQLRTGAQLHSGAELRGRNADAAACDGDRVSRLALTALALGLLAAGQAFAADPLGTSGRIRTFAFANCGAPIMQQIEGACDPAPVADSLPAPERAQAHLKRAVALVGFGRVD